MSVIITVMILRNINNLYCPKDETIWLFDKNASRICSWKGKRNKLTWICTVYWSILIKTEVFTEKYIVCSIKNSILLIPYFFFQVFLRPQAYNLIGIASNGSLWHARTGYHCKIYGFFYSSMASGLFYPYHMDESISQLRDARFT